MSPACRISNDVISPFGGGEAATWVGVLAKVQTTSVKNAESRGVVGEVVCVLVTTVSVVECCLYANL